MAVDPDDIDAIVRQVSAIYRDAEDHLARLVADSLRKGIDGPTWAAERQAAVGALRRSAQQIIAALLADATRAIREAVVAAWRLGTGAALVDLPADWIPRSGVGQAARAALRTVSLTGPVESLAAALVRDLTEVTQAVLRVVIDTYRAVIAGAVGRVLTANTTRRDAAQQAWQGLVDRGVASFVDVSGRRWQLSSYVEMATRTVTARAAVQAQTDRLGTLGVGLVYVSDSPQECKLCRPFEGKVLALTGEPGRRVVEHATRDGHMVTVDVVDTLAGARLRGLFHPNCRHSVSAYLAGVTRLPAQPTADPVGDVARQRQRAIERAIRKWKLRDETALTPDAAKAARRKVLDWQAEMRAHLAQHPYLKRLPYRESRGAGNQPRRGTRANPAPALGPDVQTELPV